MGARLTLFSPSELAVMQQYHVLPPAVTDKLLAYAHIRYALLFVRELWVWVSLWLVLQLGWSARLRDLAARITRQRFLQIALYVTALTAVLFVLRLPFNIYSGYMLEHQFSLSNEPFLSFIGDLLKFRVIEILEDTVGFAIAFAVIDRFAHRWPVLLWIALVPLIAFAIFVYPLVVDPLFNKYTPMADTPEKVRIEQLAARVGLPNVPVFVVDKSRQTTKLNAEVTGLGPSARVVIWDTTLRRLPPDELLAVVGHELGHYVLGHVFLGFLMVCAGLFVGLQIAARVQARLVAWLPERWGIKRLTDPACIAALMLGGSLLAFVGDPLINLISREIEHQADEFGLKVTGNRTAMARAFVILAEDNLSDPDPPPFIRFWFFAHPTLRERIDFALGITH